MIFDKSIKVVARDSNFETEKCSKCREPRAERDPEICDLVAIDLKAAQQLETTRTTTTTYYYVFGSREGSTNPYIIFLVGEEHTCSRRHNNREERKHQAACTVSTLTNRSGIAIQNIFNFRRD